MVKKRKRLERKHRSRKQRSGAASYGYFQLIADAGVFCLIVLLGLAAVFAYFARDLPDTNKLWHNNATPKITLLAVDGSPIRIHGASAGAPVRLGCSLHGSLAFTGKGHASDRAVILGLAGFLPDTLDPAKAGEIEARIRDEKRFASADELVTQIRQDIATARDVL